MFCEEDEDGCGLVVSVDVGVLVVFVVRGVFIVVSVVFV